MSEKNRDYILFLEDIIEAIAKIERYTKGMGFAQFSVNDMAIDAVIRNFEIIGEAAGRIPSEVRNRYPHVEWKEAMGFRNVLIHGYFGIDLEAVWDTIQKNIPLFKDHISAVLESEKSRQ